MCHLANGRRDRVVAAVAGRAMSARREHPGPHPRDVPRGAGRGLADFVGFARVCKPVPVKTMKPAMEENA